jgi:glycosyltransferase involved in cell wall biosynthesis
MSTFRVLWISPTLNHYKASLLAHLSEHVSLTVFAGTGQSGAGHPPASCDHPFSIVKVSAPRRWFAVDPRVQLALASTIRSLRPHAVLLPMERRLAPLLPIVSALRLQYGFDLLSYNHLTVRSSGKPPGAWEILQSRWLMAWYDRLVFYTKQVKRDAIQAGLIASGRAFHANNTLDTDAIWQGYTYGYPPPEAPPTLLFLGRLLPSKRVGLFLSYVAALKRQIPGLRAIIIGDGPQSPLVRDACSVEPAFEWLGALSDERRIGEAMSRAHLVFVPGWSGLSVVHAFCYGRPYVTIQDSGVLHAPEFGYLSDGENGLLLSGQPAADLARLGELLLDRERMMRLSRSAYQTAQGLRAQDWCEQMAQALTAGRQDPPMRVLFVGPTPPPCAGPEAAMQQLLNSRLVEEFDVQLLRTNVRRSNEDKGRPGLPLVKAFVSFNARLVRDLLVHRPEVVYSFVTATRLGWLGRDVWCVLLARALGARVVLHMRAGHFRNNLRSASRIEHAIIRRACRAASLCLVQAESLRTQFEGLAPPERIEVVPNMINTTRYSDPAPTAFDPNLVLFLGHLSTAKGFCDLLKALPDVATRHPDVRLCCAGARITSERNVFHTQTTGEVIPPEDPEDLVRATTRGPHAANYRYLGFLAEGAKLEWLRQCSFLVLPSHSEGFSMAVLEAMSMGKPVICTPVGAMRDVVQDGVNGLLVPPGDPERLAEAMCRLLADRELRDRIATRNGTYVREHFTQDVVAEELALHFRRLAPSQSQRR